MSVFSIDWVQRAPAKINLALDVLGERGDGYHEIDTVMQELEFGDVLHFSTREGEGCHLTCNRADLETGSTNLVYRAWEKLKGRVSHSGVAIHIEKQIPIAAGLAGGSSDACATLLGLNQLWGLQLSQGELKEIALELGSDVPFFLHGKTMRAQGRGERLTPLRPLVPHDVVLVHCGVPLSSREIYQRLHSDGTLPVQQLVQAIQTGMPLPYDCCKNIMETVSDALVPEIPKIREQLQRYGADVARMSGSGATVFGLFHNTDQAQQAYERLVGTYPTVLWTKTVS